MIKNNLDDLKKMKIEIERNNYNSIKYFKFLNDYLVENPNSISARLLLCKVYFDSKDYEKSIIELKKIIDKDPENKRANRNLFLTYYYIREYELAYEMVKKLYKIGCINSLYLIELMLRKKLGMKINTKPTTYYIKQILNYDDEKAISNIIDAYSSKSEQNPISFNENIDISKLFCIIKESINNSIRANKLDIYDIYYFCIRNVGSDLSNTFNTIRVICMPETNQIFTICPCTDVNPNETNYLVNNDIYKDINKNNKQVQKFYKKYNKNN